MAIRLLPVIEVVGNRKHGDSKQAFKSQTDIENICKIFPHEITLFVF
jgi:hypothetical protein